MYHILIIYFELDEMEARMKGNRGKLAEHIMYIQL